MSTRTVFLHYTGIDTPGGVEVALNDLYTLSRLLKTSAVVFAGRGAADETIPLLAADNHEILAANASVMLRGDSRLAEDIADHLVKELLQCLQPEDVIHAHNIINNTFNLPLVIALRRILDVMPTTRVVAWCWDPVRSFASRLHPKDSPLRLVLLTWPKTLYVCLAPDRERYLRDDVGVPSDRIVRITPYIHLGRMSGVSDRAWKIIVEHDLLGAGLTIAYPCRLSRRKNLEYALEVVYELKKLKSDIRCLLGGFASPHRPAESKAYWEEIQVRIDKLGLRSEIILLPVTDPLSSSDIVSVLRIIDVFLSTSVDEGFGLGIVEAMLAGAKVVVPADVVSAIRDRANLNVFDRNQDPSEVAAMVLGLGKLHIASRIEIAHYCDPRYWNKVEELNARSKLL